MFLPALKSTAACVLINDPPQQKDLGDFDKKKTVTIEQTFLKACS